jgi:hypothetical protein
VTITLREILWVGFWLAVFMAFLFGAGFAQEIAYDIKTVEVPGLQDTNNTPVDSNPHPSPGSPAICAPPVPSFHHVVFQSTAL